MYTFIYSRNTGKLIKIRRVWGWRGWNENEYENWGKKEGGQEYMR